MKNMSCYLIYLEPYVYINKKKNGVLILNVITQNKFVSFDELILDICENILEKGFYIVDDLKKVLQNAQIKTFIEWLTSSFSGEVIPIEDRGQLPLILKEQNSDLLEDDFTLGIPLSLTFYLNSSCKYQCEECELAYKQFLYCKKSQSSIELNWNQIESFLNNVADINIKELIFIGGDVLNYTYLSQLNSFIQTHNIQTTLIFNILHLKDRSILDMILHDNISIQILIPNQYEDISFIKKIRSYLEVVKTTFNYITYNLQDFIFCEENNFVPLIYYKPENISFLEENVFLEQEDIFINCLSYEKIDLNAKVNQFFLGKLKIDSNGNVYQYFDDKYLLGNINNFSYTQLINKLSHNCSLNLNTLVRRSVAPCSDCIYENCCPPISNYELFIGKFNLCNINNLI